jgi:regulator of RNase E activity RraA
MRSEIKIRTTWGKFIGPALTVKLYPGDLVDFLDPLRIADPGDVLSWMPMERQKPPCGAE